ncbi:hypothetical protein FJQ87_07890 [Shewanella sp. SNU WT4]|uniref:hypothetical protein n=1 Tax=Shewanella sp. SNU WT4 TaxID=2590015 RepID=UPI001127DF6C|nr:hypothetical protein [Shewanella sp. SNU WT4]QDF66640.1 hypothetical protein FJQ87_07890 [Shewanella sp. SNU WT4]
MGSIKGTIPSALTSECEIAAAGSDFHQVVYLYPQSTSLDNMSDFRGAATPAPQVAPIAAARVNDILNANKQVIGQGYELGFVVAGNYSLGYTCVAQNDDPEAINRQDDAAPFFIFADTQAVVVTKGVATEANF